MEILSGTHLVDTSVGGSHLWLVGCYHCLKYSLATIFVAFWGLCLFRVTECGLVHCLLVRVLDSAIHVRRYLPTRQQPSSAYRQAFVDCCGRLYGNRYSVDVVHTRRMLDGQFLRFSAKRRMFFFFPDTSVPVLWPSHVLIQWVQNLFFGVKAAGSEVEHGLE